VLGEERERGKPHCREHAEEWCKWTEGRTLVHEVEASLGSCAGEIRRRSEPSFPGRRGDRPSPQGRGRTEGAPVVLSLDRRSMTDVLAAAEVAETGQRCEERDQSGQRQESLHLHVVTSF